MKFLSLTLCLFTVQLFFHPKLLATTGNEMKSKHFHLSISFSNVFNHFLAFDISFFCWSLRYSSIRLPWNPTCLHAIPMQHPSTKDHVIIELLYIYRTWKLIACHSYETCFMSVNCKEKNAYYFRQFPFHHHQINWWLCNGKHSNMNFPSCGSNLNYYLFAKKCTFD